jgi:transcriptional regulator GlxA family with amidase domain
MNAIPATPALQPRRVAMLIFGGCAALDVAGPLEVFGFAERWLQLTGQAPGSGFANHLSGSAYALTVLARQPGPVTTMSGLQIVAERAIGEADEDIDTLIIAGGMGVEQARKDPDLVAWINGMAGRVRRVASICTGAFLLAESGLLKGRRATTHWNYCHQLAAEFPDVTVEPDRIAVRDGAVYSSGGITAGIDLTLSLVEEDWGRETATMVGRWILVFPNRPGGQSQFSACLMNGLGARQDFRELQDWIVGHPGEELSVETLAARMSMSPRHFARTFEREVGLTPAKFVELARLERARAQLEQTRLPVESIARQCGFSTTEQMRRTFQRALKVSPLDYRARFRYAGHGPELGLGTYREAAS